jgi:hypothetical protein
LSHQFLAGAEVQLCGGNEAQVQVAGDIGALGVKLDGGAADHDPFDSPLAKGRGHQARQLEMLERGIVLRGDVRQRRSNPVRVHPGSLLKPDVLGDSERAGPESPP